MKVYLSTKDLSDSSYKHCSNLASFDNSCLDSEITSLIIDCFLSSFSFNELEEVTKQILRDDLQLQYFNEIFFQNGKKSIMNTTKLESLIPENFEVQQKYISESSLSVLKIRRVR